MDGAPHQVPDTPARESLLGGLRLVYIANVEVASAGEHLDAALMGGVSSIWLRDPGASGRQLYRAARSLIARCQPRKVGVIVGDRADVALASGADGVHLGFRSPPAAKVRPWFPGWLGVSCHNEREIESARSAGADYVTVSPVFGVPDKGAPLGVALLARWNQAAGLPIVALGGIDEDNVADVRGAQVAGVAVIRALRAAADPARTARLLASRS